MFRFIENMRRRRENAERLYAIVQLQARRPEFFLSHNVPDTVDGRFELILLHAFLFWNRSRGEGKEGAKLAQALFDAMFRDMERALRLIGVGDLGVPHHMRRMMKGFKGRAMAYREGLENPDDPEVMLGAISRNLFGTIEEITDDAPLYWFAAYIKRQAGYLAAQPWTDLAAGIISFEGTEHVEEIPKKSDDSRMAARG